MALDENPLGELGSGTDPSATPGGFYRAAWFFYLVLAVAGVLWIGAHFGDIPRSLFFDTSRWLEDLLLGGVSALALIVAWWLLSLKLEAMRQVEASIRQKIGPLETDEVFALALISGFAEELLFRGAMQSSWGWTWALLVFTVLHTGPERSFRVWTVFAFVAGALFAWLTVIRGNLLPAMTAHILVNAVNLYRLMRLRAEDLAPP